MRRSANATKPPPYRVVRFAGIGNPQPLEHELAGYWSRRITKEHRFVYEVVDGKCIVVQGRYH
ncbi:MAG: Txe/YoeB family addiction module toxin [Pseudomonadales bacterium]|nr:Txe/YoeB family addiction module toxin [Pseudomonadales bacterium]